MYLLQNIDFAILDFIRKYFTCGFLDMIMPIITTLGNAGVLWIVVAVVCLLNKKTRKCGIMMVVALLFSLLIGNIILKPLVARTRPFDINTDIILLIKKPLDFSFPSGHSMASFAAATIIYYNNKKYGIFSLILAGLIAFSRLYLYVHFPSDVIAGILIGSLIGWLTIQIFKRYNEKLLVK